jgi:hypothetical protein
MTRWLKPWLCQDSGSYWCLACQTPRRDPRKPDVLWCAAIKIKRASRRKLRRWLHAHTRCGLHQWKGMGLADTP